MRDDPLRDDAPPVDEPTSVDEVDDRPTTELPPVEGLRPSRPRWLTTLAPWAVFGVVAVVVIAGTTMWASWLQGPAADRTAAARVTVAPATPATSPASTAAEPTAEPTPEPTPEPVVERTRPPRPRARTPAPSASDPVVVAGSAPETPAVTGEAEATTSPAPAPPSAATPLADDQVDTRTAADGRDECTARAGEDCAADEDEESRSSEEDEE